MDGKSLSSTTSLHMFSCTLIAAMLPDLQIDLNQRNISEMDYRFHAAHLDRGLTIHEAVPGGFNRAGEGL